MSHPDAVLTIELVNKETVPEALYKLYQRIKVYEDIQNNCDRLSKLAYKEMIKSYADILINFDRDNLNMMLSSETNSRFRNRMHELISENQHLADILQDQ